MDIEHKTLRHTTPITFLTWVKKEIQNRRRGLTDPDIVYSDDNKNILYKFQINAGFTQDKYEIQANTWTHIKKDGRVVESSPNILGTAMVFEAILVSESKNVTQIVGRCKNYPGIREYFEKFWETIILTFPEYTGKHELVETTQSKENEAYEQKIELSSEIKPWEQIPDHYWDRDALRLWWSGYTNIEIGKSISVTPRRVTNRLSDLRKLFGEEIVPKKEQRDKHLRKSRDTV